MVGMGTVTFETRIKAIVTPARTCGCSGKGMKKIGYTGYRFPMEINS